MIWSAFGSRLTLKGSRSWSLSSLQLWVSDVWSVAAVVFARGRRRREPKRKRLCVWLTAGLGLVQEAASFSSALVVGGFVSVLSRVGRMSSRAEEKGTERPAVHGC